MKGTPDLALVTAANSGGTAARIPEGRRFQPGHSGNPLGRPKRDLEVAELARAHTADAIEALVSIISDSGAPPSARVAAATAILDRGWGRPPQALDVQHRVTLEEEFESFVRELQIGLRAASAIQSRSE